MWFFLKVTFVYYQGRPCASATMPFAHDLKLRGALKFEEKKLVSTDKIWPKCHFSLGKSLEENNFAINIHK